MSRRELPPPEEVTATAREIFERSEFQRSRSPVQRLLEWLGDRLDGLFPDPPVGGVGGASWGGAIAQLVLWFLIVSLAVGLVVLVVMIARGYRPRRKKRSTEVEVDIDEHRSVADWKRSAESFERDGNWKEAIRCRYRELIGRLVELEAVGAAPGRTTGELRSDLIERVPMAATAFIELTTLFELPWYADRPTGPEENARFVTLATDVLGHATAARRSETPPPAAESGAGPELVGSPR